MKPIGLIGGMSWESSIEYYRLLNEGVRARLGGLHSAKCILYSVDFAEIEKLQRSGNWTAASEVLLTAARKLEQSGAGVILLCTNTMHKLADAIQAGIGIPLLHIADATGKKVKEAGIQQVGLLGTRFTMEEGFYRDRLKDQFGLNVIIPNQEDRVAVHRIIFEELCVGKIRQESKAQAIGIVERMVQRGSEAIILGCTELGLLLDNGDNQVPLFDTTHIHASAGLDYAFNPAAAS